MEHPDVGQGGSIGLQLCHAVHSDSQRGGTGGLDDATASEGSQSKTVQDFRAGVITWGFVMGDWHYCG